MSPTITNAVIRHGTELFVLQGTPIEAFTDNGQSFNSREWSIFTPKYGFKHTTSSSHYPQFNVFIERDAHTMKSALNKAKALNIRGSHALMKLRQTTIEPYLPNPIQILHK